MNLLEFRETLFKFDQATVARYAGMDEERLRDIEVCERIPDADDLDKLSKVYGFPVTGLERLVSPRCAGEGFGVLARAKECQDFNLDLQLHINRLASGVWWLTQRRKGRGLLAPPDPQTLPRLFPREINELQPFAQGAKLAQRTRKWLKLKPGPIDSMRDFLQKYFPWITVFYEKMGSYALDGLTFHDADLAPTIIINLNGRNENPSARRISLAHELCHVLMDKPQAQPLAMISRLDGRDCTVEQRAFAFAVRLLCPEAEIRQMTQRVDDRNIMARDVMKKYGLSYQAVQMYFRNVIGITLSRTIPPECHLSPEELEQWRLAETPEKKILPGTSQHIIDQIDAFLNEEAEAGPDPEEMLLAAEFEEMDLTDLDRVPTPEEAGKVVLDALHNLFSALCSKARLESVKQVVIGSNGCFEEEIGELMLEILSIDSERAGHYQRVLFREIQNLVKDDAASLSGDWGQLIDEAGVLVLIPTLEEPLPLLAPDPTLDHPS